MGASEEGVSGYGRGAGPAGGSYGERRARSDACGMTDGKDGRTARGQVGTRVHWEARQATQGRRQRVAVRSGRGPAGDECGAEGIGCQKSGLGCKGLGKRRRGKSVTLIFPSDVKAQHDRMDGLFERGTRADSLQLTVHGPPITVRR